MASTSPPPAALCPPSADAFAAYLALWTDGLRRDGLDARIAAVVDEAAIFQDPFNDLRGHAGFRKVIEDALTRCVDPRFLMLETAIGSESAYARWRFVARLASGRAIDFEGVSQLAFTQAGRCARHVDFTDSQHIYGLVPALGPVLRFVRRRIAAG